MSLFSPKSDGPRILRRRSLFDRRDSRVRRKLLLGTYGVLLLGLTGGAVAYALAVLAQRASFPNRLVEIGDVLAGGTLVLAALAGLVALQAYASATGLPQLQLQFLVGSSDLNDIMLEIDESKTTEAKPFSFTATYSKLTDGFISINNRSGYSARNPSLSVQLHGIGIEPESYSASPGWNIIEHTREGISWLQWEANPASSIHGYSQRRLTLDLGKVVWRTDLDEPDSDARRRMMSRGEPSITFTLFAEGYRRSVQVPVDFFTTGQPGSQFPWRGNQPREWL